MASTTRLLLVLVLFVTIAGCKTYHKVDTNVEHLRINSDLGDEDDELVAMIRPYKIELEKEMNRVLCFNSTLLERGKPESTLTNWFSDLLMSTAKKKFDDDLDFAVQNYGGIRRTSLPKGDLTVGLVYEVMPFDNELIVLQMTGDEVQRFCDRMARSGGWPVSRELRFRIYLNHAVDVTINGQPLDPNGIYNLVINDYIANGGDGMNWLRTLPRIQKGLLIRDAMIEELEKVDTIPRIALDSRITIESE